VNPGTFPVSFEYTETYKEESKPWTDGTTTSRLAHRVGINPSIKAGADGDSETQKHWELVNIITDLSYVNTNH
jgi:hypothetical protein